MECPLVDQMPLTLQHMDVKTHTLMHTMSARTHTHHILTHIYIMHKHTYITHRETQEVTTAKS